MVVSKKIESLFVNIVIFLVASCGYIPMGRYGIIQPEGSKIQSIRTNIETYKIAGFIENNSKLVFYKKDTDPNIQVRVVDIATNQVTDEFLFGKEPGFDVNEFVVTESKQGFILLSDGSSFYYSQIQNWKSQSLIMNKLDGISVQYPAKLVQQSVLGASIVPGEIGKHTLKLIELNTKKTYTSGSVSDTSSFGYSAKLTLDRLNEQLLISSNKDFPDVLTLKEDGSLQKAPLISALYCNVFQGFYFLSPQKYLSICSIREKELLKTDLIVYDKQTDGAIKSTATNTIEIPQSITSYGTYENFQSIQQVVFSPDRKFFTIKLNGYSLVYDAELKQIKKFLWEGITSNSRIWNVLPVGPDKVVAVSDSLYQWDWPREKQLSFDLDGTFGGEPVLIGEKGVRIGRAILTPSSIVINKFDNKIPSEFLLTSPTLSFSPNQNCYAQTLVSIQIYCKKDFGYSRLTGISPPNNIILDFASWSPIRGQWFFSYSKSEGIGILVDMETFDQNPIKQLFKEETNPLLTANWINDDTLVTIHKNGKVFVWNVSTASLLQELELGRAYEKGSMIRTDTGLMAVLVLENKKGEDIQFERFYIEPE